MRKSTLSIRHRLPKFSIMHASTWCHTVSIQDIAIFNTTWIYEQSTLLIVRLCRQSQNSTCFQIHGPNLTQNWIPWKTTSYILSATYFNSLLAVSIRNIRLTYIFRNMFHLACQKFQLHDWRSLSGIQDKHNFSTTRQLT